MARLILTLAVAMLLSGCNTHAYVDQNFSDISEIRLTDPATKRVFIIFDKPSESRLLITLDNNGVIEMTVANRYAVPINQFERVGLEWLASVGRKCHSSGIAEVYPVKYELKYAC